MPVWGFGWRKVVVRGDGSVERGGGGVGMKKGRRGNPKKQRMKKKI